MTYISSIEMEEPRCSSRPLHTLEPLRRTPISRAFAAVYMCAIFVLFYHHALTLVVYNNSTSNTLFSFFISISLLFSDLVLAFMWATTQSFRFHPIRRQTFIENLEQVVTKNSNNFPALDVFICTADPYKEPPMSVVNTALSVMAYEYPPEKISIYVSDDGGSELTLFAFMEAAKFATHWLPFCKDKNLVDRCPDAFFGSNDHPPQCPETLKIKMMYESMKVRVENVVLGGKVGEEYINGAQETEAFNKWSHKFTPQDHPTVIQVLLESIKDKDVTGHLMPNLIYVSRQKSKGSPHQFKAGALNVLLRVSSIITNAPIILTLDCDMYSNDPQTPKHVLCYLSDPTIRSNLAYVQFPQRFHGINKNDIYACEHKYLFQINPPGMDGLSGPNYVGTGCFFSRRAFFGSPSSQILPDISELSPENVVDKPIKSQAILALAHQVADCNFENDTLWGHKMGFRYGSLVEDYFTGYQLKCEGWKSIFCHPKRAAFLGDIPINLNDVLIQNKRWCIGLLEVTFSKYSPVTFGAWSMGPLMGLCYAHYSFWPIVSIPVLTYAILPQLALLNRLSIFPKVMDPWFFLYAFLFLGSYTQDFLDFVLAGGTVQRWWSNQRMWMMRAISCYSFGFFEYLLKTLGLSMHGFNVTSKVVDEEQGKRYENGVFEFGVASPMFVTFTTAAIINLVSFSQALIDVFLMRQNVNGLLVQMFLAGFVVVNCWPIYEAILLRSDKGRMPTKITLVSTFLAWVIYEGASLCLKI